VTLERPLLAGVVRREDGALVIRTAARAVRIDGDAALAAIVLERCDGHHGTADILAVVAPADRGAALDLLAALEAERAVVDCTQAWRVLQEQAGWGSSFFPAPSPADLARIATERWSPEAPGASSIALDPAPTTIAEVAAARTSALPRRTPRPVAFTELSALLGVMAGPSRPAASAGALHPLVVHVILRTPLDPLAPGVWWYEADAGRLRPVREGIVDVHEAFLPLAPTDALLARGNPILVLSADVARTSGKYGNRAYRYALIEVGSAWQNAALAATELGVPARPVGGFAEAPLARLLGLGDAQPLLAVLLGA